MSHKHAPDSGWRRIGGKTVYKNRWIELVEDDILLPGGEKSIYGFLKMAGGIGVMPVDSDGKIYLVGQYRYPIKKYSWEVVRGGCEAGESFLAAAKRELREEMKLVAKRWTEIDRAHTMIGASNDYVVIFRAEGLRWVPQPDSINEPTEVKKVSVAQALRMIKNGEITESVTIISIYRYIIMGLGR